VILDTLASVEILKCEFSHTSHLTNTKDTQVASDLTVNVSSNNNKMIDTKI